MKPECKDTIEELVSQVEGAGYRDRIGHPLENNVAFRKAKRLAEEPADRPSEKASFEDDPLREDAPRH